jgi:hypothetical protein
MLKAQDQIFIEKIDLIEIEIFDVKLIVFYLLRIYFKGFFIVLKFQLIEQD